MPNRGKNRQYTTKKLDDAVSAVRAKTMGYKKASKLYGIPKTTLVDHVLGRYTPGGNPGRPPVIPAKYEEALIKQIIKASNVGFGITKKQLLVKVARMCTSLKIPNPFRKGIPGDDWWQGLKRRHPNLVLRKPEKLATARIRMVNGPVLKKYFDDLGQVVQAQTDLELGRDGQAVRAHANSSLRPKGDALSCEQGVEL